MHSAILLRRTISCCALLGSGSVRRASSPLLMPAVPMMRLAPRSAERKCQPLRRMKEEDGIELFFIKLFPEGEKVAGKRLFKDEKFVDVRIVFEHFHSNGACENCEIAVGLAPPDVFNGGSGPKSVAESCGCNNEDLVGFFVFGMNSRAI